MPSQWSPVETSGAEVRRPVASSPRSIWNPALKPQVLLAKAQLPSLSSPDTAAPQD